MEINENKKKMIGVAGLAAIAIIAIIFIPKVMGTNKDNSGSDSKMRFIQKEGGKNVDLSMYQPRLDDKGQVIGRERPSQQNSLNDDQIFISDDEAAVKYQEFINSEDLPMLQEIEIFYVDGTGKMAKRDQAATSTQSAPIRSASTQSASSSQTTQQQNQQTQQQIVEKGLTEEELLAQRLAAIFSEENTEKTNATVGETKGINAVVHEEQKLANNGRLKMRTTEKGSLNGVDIPANSFLYGTVSFSQNRVKININRAVINGRDVQIQSKVYDASDGNEGLFLDGVDIDGMIQREGMTELQGTLNQAGALGRLAGAVVRTTSSGQQEIIMSNNHKVIIK